MGEYARRKIDGKDIKIGTCKSMFYCRYEQIGELVYPYMSDNLYWRIPTPDEDGLKPGDFNYSLLFEDGRIPWRLMIDTTKFSEEDVRRLQKQGTVQLKEPHMGLLVNIRCPHGLDVGEDFQKHEEGIFCSMGYNGRQDTLYLKGLKNEPTELKVLVECSACGSMWSFSFNEIEPLIKSLWLKLRLLHQISDYHYQHSEDSYTVTVSSKQYCGKKVSISQPKKGWWIVKSDDVVVSSGDWERCKNYFISTLPYVGNFEGQIVNSRNEELYSIACEAEEMRSNINNI